MKKYILVLSLLIFIPFLAKADTTVFGFMNGNFYDANQELKYACLQDGNCWDYSTSKLTTLSTILGLASGQPSTITITSPSVDNVPVNPAPIITVLPSPAPTPTPNPTPAPSPVPTSVPTLLPAYTEQELATKLGSWRAIYGEKVYFVNFGCGVSSAASARCSGSGNGSDKVQILFKNQVIWDGSLNYGGLNNVIISPNGDTTFIDNITGLTPNTDYSYQIIYSESGRENTIINKSFHTN